MQSICREILDSYQVRKSKADKLRFIQFLRGHYPELRVEEGGTPRCRNLVIGDPEQARVVYTAHYDTCARLPFPNLVAPKNLFVTLLYSLLLAIPFFVFAFGLELLLILWAPDSLWWVSPLGMFVTLGLVLYVFILGPANPHTVNDNTSGVLLLCELLESMSPEQRDKAAFVFFDHEETGLFGSSWFMSRHKALMRDKLLVNFDCVSDGDTLLFVQTGKARKGYEELLRRAYTGQEGKELRFDRSSRAFYPSDQMNFPCSVAVAALKKAPLIGLYLDRIHTPRDTVLDERNLELLRRGSLRFTDLL